MIKKTSKYKTPEAWIGTNCASRLTVNLPDEMHAKFKSLTSAKRIKMTTCVLKMVKDYIEKEEKSVMTKQS